MIANIISKLKSKLANVIPKLIPYIFERVKYDTQLGLIIGGSIILIIISIFNSLDLLLAIIVFVLIFIISRLYKIETSINSFKQELTSIINDLNLQKKVIDEHIQAGGDISLEDRFFLETFNNELEKYEIELDSLPKIKL